MMMMAGVRAAPWGAPGLWALLLALPLARAVEVEDKYLQTGMYQESFPSGRSSGEMVLELNREEAFHLDTENKEYVWRLPEFGRSIGGGGIQVDLNNLFAVKTNLGTLTERSNRTQAQNVAPSATVYPEDPVDLGEPNVLICFVDKFFPPVLNITWLKNGQEVSRGVQETVFLSSMDHTFRKFSYLPFVPEEGDLYACRVDHWGLRESLTRLWYPRNPTPPPKTGDSVVCGLGLAFALVGVVAGPALFFKARKMQMQEANVDPRGGL